MLVKLIKFASAAHWECYNSAVLLLTVQKEAKSKLLRFLYQNLNVNVVIIHSVMLKCLTFLQEICDSTSMFSLHVPIEQVKCVLLTTGLQIYAFSS